MTGRAISDDYEAPGSPYMPSNGTEGACFHESWCANCERDKVMNGSASIDEADRDPSLYCSILSKSFSVKQLPEWKYDDEGNPMCTAFVPVGDEVPQPRCTRTIDLFESARTE